VWLYRTRWGGMLHPCVCLVRRDPIVSSSTEFGERSWWTRWKDTLRSMTGGGLFRSLTLELRDRQSEDLSGEPFERAGSCFRSRQ